MSFWEVTLFLLDGFKVTCLLFFLTLVFSLPLGLLICAGTRTSFRPVRYLMRIFVWIIRGVPLMLQLFIVFYVPGIVFDVQLPDLVLRLFGSAVKVSARFLSALIAFVINYACYGLVAVLAIVSIVVINNTIKITVFNRRKEIGIMKLVGATNGFIRFPFFVEGVTSGLISAGIASGIVCGAYYALCRWYAENPSNLSQMFGGTLVPLESVWYYIVGGFVLLGFVLCGLGTATSIRKHLNV